MHIQQYKTSPMKQAICSECNSKSFLYSKGKLVCQNCNKVFQKPRRSKYGNKKQVVNGIKYDSKLEADYGSQFELMLKAGELKNIRRQVKLDLRAYGEHICNYIIDFILEYADGTIEYAEVKGYATDLWKFKWRLLEAQLKETEPGAVMKVYK